MDRHFTNYVARLSAQELSRSDFLRTLGRAAIVGVGAATSVGWLSKLQAQTAQAYEVDVYPTGTYPNDVYEVNAAVNGGVGPSGTSYPGGGIVRLRATNQYGVPTFFHFGDNLTGRGSVNATRDVVIVGELSGPVSFSFPGYPAPDASFTPDRTVIFGGRRPLCCRGTNAFATRLTVRNLYFAFPSLVAVQVNKSAGLEVTDCVVYEVEMGLNDLGIGATAGLEATGGVIPIPQLSGEFRIVNNRIRRALATSSPPNFSPADGGIVLQRASMTAHIASNEVSGFAFTGIGIDRNDGKASISGNFVTSCGYGLSPLSNGIGIRGTRESIVIERNEIESGLAAPSSSLRSKCGIAVASANATVRANRLTGTAASYGVFLATAVLPEATVRATNVSLLDNRMSDLVAESAQLSVAGTCDNNRSANNQYGSVANQGLAGIAVQGNENHLINERFVGTYGSSAMPLPCVWLRTGSSGNRVEALKYRDAPQGMDLCGRIRDDGTNVVPGYERCKFL